MKQEQIIQKLLKQAKEVSEVEIDSKTIKKMDLQAFYKQKGDVYYPNSIFYKKSKEGWFLAKIEPFSKENNDILVNKRVDRIINSN